MLGHEATENIHHHRMYNREIALLEKVLGEITNFYTKLLPLGFRIQTFSQKQRSDAFLSSRILPIPNPRHLLFDSIIKSGRWISFLMHVCVVVYLCNTVPLQHPYLMTALGHVCLYQVATDTCCWSESSCCICVFLVTSQFFPLKATDSRHIQRWWSSCNLFQDK